MNEARQEIKKLSELLKIGDLTIPPYPTDKKKMFQHDNSSLKRLIMFEAFENDKWEAEQIKKHEVEINELINTLY